MIKQLVAELLKSIGCAVSINGDVLEASRGGSKLAFGFMTEEGADEIIKDLQAMNRSVVLVPLFEGFSEDEARSKDMSVVDRDELEDDVIKVLKGLKSMDDTILGGLVSECLGEAEELQEAMIKPTITREEIVEIGQKTVDGFNYLLDLVPYFLFEYKSSYGEEGEEIHESKGVIGVNALTMSPEVWSEDFETVDGLEYFDKKLEPKVDEEEAFRVAQKEAIEQGAMVKETVRERNDARVEERKRVKPKKEDVYLESKGLVYLPIWCVEGAKGSIIVNASTGKILKEDRYS